ncbi:MAG: polyketide synthase, partial [Planctomycetes bacterium]|nr:polyketide synthase [Planctomycetota bacterium]
MTHVADIPLAIVGMACRLPGADDLDAYWRLLSEGASALGPLPPERFDAELYYHPEKGRRTKSYTRLGGYVPDTPFDHRKNPLPDELIEQSHKVHLKLFEVAANAFRHGGIDPYRLPTRRVGVYIGHTPPSALAGGVIYARQVAHAAQYLRKIPGFSELVGGRTDEVIEQMVRLFRDRFTVDHPSIRMCGNAYHAAAVITRGLDLDGPSMSFDAACASSLRALGHAARALQHGQVEMALVGGASYVHSDCLVLFSQAQSVSPCGTRPFDADADGLVASEGYIALCVKTLERALADGDRIQAVIRGIGIASDGKGKSLWAPRQEGQIEAIRRAYGPGLKLDDLQYIEMHATSTQVGDATEIGALTRVLAGEITGGRKIPVGSVKANVGHTLETAGLASLVKTVLAMQQGVIPHQINVRQLNPTIDWDQVPFYVPLEPTRWDAPAPGVPRRAAVNAFGIGGLNVHVILDEHVHSASRKLAAAIEQSPTAHESSGKPNERRDYRREPVAIVGVGAVLPGARTIEHLWDVLREGRDQKTTVPPERWDTSIGLKPGSDELWTVPTATGGFITGFEYDWKKHKVPPKQVASADPLQFMLLDAADQALKDAGYDRKPYDRTRTGVIVGTIFGGEFADQLQMGLGLPEFQRELTLNLRQRGVPEDQIARVCADYEDLLLQALPALIDETGSFTASTLASRITKTFDLMGGAVAVDSGDASAMAALHSCIDILRAGDCDLMICAAGHRSAGFATYEALARTGQLSRGTPRGPFAADADGCVPADGVGVLILKRLCDAERDGDRIHAIIRGVGVARRALLEEGAAEAIRRGLADAGLTPESVAAVEASSTGIAKLDRAELSALRETYGARSHEESLRVGTVAAQFGNLGGASGAVQLLKAAAELERAEFPPNAGPERPVEQLAGDALPLKLVRRREPVPGLNDDGRVYAGINSYSQAHVAYHVVLEGTARVPATPRAKPAAVPSTSTPGRTGDGVPWKIIRLAAA